MRLGYAITRSYCALFTSVDLTQLRLRHRNAKGKEQLVAAGRHPPGCGHLEFLARFPMTLRYFHKLFKVCQYLFRLLVDANDDDEAVDERTNSKDSHSHSQSQSYSYSNRIYAFGASLLNFKLVLFGPRSRSPKNKQQT